jgi:hypothetical protein
MLITIHYAANSLMLSSTLARFSGNAYRQSFSGKPNMGGRTKVAGATASIWASAEIQAVRFITNAVNSDG